MGKGAFHGTRILYRNAWNAWNKDIQLGVSECDLLIAIGAVFQ